MDISTEDCILLTEEAYTSARKGSSDAREAVTLFAENGCVMNADIQHHNHLTMENTTQNVEDLTVVLLNALKKIEQLEKTIADLTK